MSLSPTPTAESFRPSPTSNKSASPRGISLPALALVCICLPAAAPLRAQVSQDQSHLLDYVGAVHLDTQYVAKIDDLLKRGVDPNFEKPYGGSPLCVAAEKDNLQIMEMLLKYGAKVDFGLQHAGYGRKTALMCAQELNAALWLVSHGAEIPQGYLVSNAAYNRTKGGPEITKYLLEHGVEVNAVDSNGWTALMGTAALPVLTSPAAWDVPIQAYGWQNEIVKLLLAHGAKKDIADSKGRTAIDFADLEPNCNVVALLDAAPYARTVQCMLDAPKKLKDDGNEKVYLEFAGYSKQQFAIVMPMVAATISVLPHPPEIPEEAHKLFVQANVTLKAAQNPQEMQSAIDLYGKAIRACPWYADAWYNLSLALEKVNEFTGAKIAMGYVMAMDTQQATQQATQERQYTLEAQQKLADQRKAQQERLTSAADYLRNQIGGHTMYRFWVFGDANLAHCIRDDDDRCRIWDSNRNSDRLGNGHNGTSLDSVASVSTENNKVVLSLGTQRFCIPIENARSVRLINRLMDTSTDESLNLTDCDHPNSKLFKVYLFPAGNRDIGVRVGTSPTFPGTVQFDVERCDDDACSTLDIASYWYKP
jgi:tetratricopeptide (TPR) repeat protein